MTSKPEKRIGILTGGGDCPGLNAVIRAVTKTAIFDHNWKVFGIEDGFLGIIENRMRPLEPDDVSGILTRGGTILGTSNKADPIAYPTGVDEDGKPVFEDLTPTCLRHIKSRELDAIIAIGGDGTMSGAKGFVDGGVNVIGVPKTIDNDLVGTDITFGFQTAVAIATDALDRIHTTADAHHRVMIVEVMGRNAGWLALHAGIASGSDVILIPEIPYNLDVIARYIEKRKSVGRHHTIVCISEGAKEEGGEITVSKLDPTSPDPIKLGGVGNKLAHDIERLTGRETRCTILGHVQRGGSPVPADRLLGTAFGHHAVNLLAEGQQGRLVVMRDNKVTDADLIQSADKQRTVPLDDPLLQAARALDTCFGDE
ncbi:MAG: ATP-dependent 6-phosphofructokinase [Planctomycetota bacterium]